MVSSIPTSSIKKKNNHEGLFLSLQNPNVQTIAQQKEKRSHSIAQALKASRALYIVYVSAQVTLNEMLNPNFEIASILSLQYVCVWNCSRSIVRTFLFGDKVDVSSYCVSIAKIRIAILFKFGVINLVFGAPVCYLLVERIVPYAVGSF